MKYTKEQITSYAHEYLSGSNLVPVGVLDDAFFKSECRRLWGPEPTAEEKATSQRRLGKQIAKFERALDKLRGPKGGIPRVGRSNFLHNLRILEAMKQGLA